MALTFTGMAGIIYQLKGSGTNHFCMKCYLLLALALLLLGCDKAPPLTPPTTQAAALVRLSEELAILAPLVAADSDSQPPRRYYVLPPAQAASSTPTYSLAEAQQLLRASPDMLNQVADLPFLGSLTSPRQKAAWLKRLQTLLGKQPELDLGWLWLAALQKDSPQAVTSLSKALALNRQVGAYYRRRASLYQARGNYPAAAHDLRRALPLYHQRWQVQGELANLYMLLRDDRQYTASWNQRQAEMSQALRRLGRRAGHDIFLQDSVRRLHDEIAYGYLAKALYFIEQRHQPALGCPALAQATAAGVAEAPALQRQYCPPGAPPKKLK
jgi:tetratricopeptide (TPR) repeat protein